MTDLDDYAAALRSAYAVARRDWERAISGNPEAIYLVPLRYDGQPARRTTAGLTLRKAQRPVWPRVVAQLRGLGVEDPAAYVRCVIGSTPPGSRPPEPNQLAAAACVDRWERAGRHRGATAAADLALDQGVFEGAWNYRRTFEKNVAPDRDLILQIVGDATVDLTPLYRYCLVLHVGGPGGLRLADRYRRAAFNQYDKSPDGYEAKWAGVLPAGFLGGRRTSDDRDEGSIR